MPKKGAWTVCRFKGELGKKEGGGLFEEGVDTPMHTMRPSFLKGWGLDNKLGDHIYSSPISRENPVDLFHCFFCNVFSNCIKTCYRLCYNMTSCFSYPFFISYIFLFPIYFSQNHLLMLQDYLHAEKEI